MKRYFLSKYSSLSDIITSLDNTISQERNTLIMSNYEEQIAEFESNISTVIDKSVRELSIRFDTIYFDRKSEDIPTAIESAKVLLSGNYNIPTKMQIYYDIANAYHDLRVIEGENTEHYLEKEVYYLRCALDIYESNFDDDDSDSAETKVAQYIAMRSYTNLGNAYRTMGRYIVAIDCFQNALIISNDFAMASLNLSFVLFSYSQLQIKRYEQSYFHHACYHYYMQTEECKVNLEKLEYLDNLKYYISLFDHAYIAQFLQKPLQLPTFQVDSQAEADYRNYLLLFRLFLDPCLDILSEHCFAVDSINLPFEEPYNDREKEFIGLFNQIKQEYNWARLLWYKISTEESREYYADRELDLIDTGDFSDFSLSESMLRSAFKAGYSLFDRIGFFINEYFEVGLTGSKVSFKNVWKNKVINGKGEVLFSVPSPIMEKHSDNPLVQAMYWLQKDFYEKKEINITTPHAEPIFKMRNDMEHNCLRTGKESNTSSFTKYTTKGKIEENTYRLLKLARELIIYLCLAVNYDRTKSKKQKSEETQLADCL